VKARPLVLVSTLLFFLLLTVTSKVAIDPNITYVGGIDTSAQNLKYTSGISTSAQNIKYMSGISTNAQNLKYTSGISTKANGLSYRLNCFIYVNNSWFALRIKAKLDDGTPISVPVTVNGTSYTVPASGLLLNWSRTAPICGYLDPIAYVSFPQSVDRYVLMSVEGIQGDTVAWPLFTVYNVTAIYTVEQSQPPSQPPPTQPSQPQPPSDEGGKPARPEEASPSHGYITIPWHLLEIVKSYWWLLILTLMLIIAVYKYHKHRSEVSVVIHIPHWAIGGR